MVGKRRRGLLLCLLPLLLLLMSEARLPVLHTLRVLLQTLRVLHALRLRCLLLPACPRPLLLLLLRLEGLDLLLRIAAPMCSLPVVALLCRLQRECVCACECV